MFKLIQTKLFAQNLIKFDFAKTECQPDKKEYHIEEIKNRIDKFCTDISKSVKRKEKKPKLMKRDYQVFQSAKDFMMRKDLEGIKNEV